MACQMLVTVQVLGTCAEEAPPKCNAAEACWRSLRCKFDVEKRRGHVVATKPSRSSSRSLRHLHHFIGKEAFQKSAALYVMPTLIAMGYSQRVQCSENRFAYYGLRATAINIEGIQIEYNDSSFNLAYTLISDHMRDVPPIASRHNLLCSTHDH
jgi:hypothetical protein